ncbi:MAG TPA: hypothetical protein VK501_24620 [Baekduia sp.]|uniref:hypothetical protein n=1 Tax=Baekduia sp. TaxID=2600305 RepID=UPI002B8C35B9|nr:hypothetical protein [Baekduia sp.]HMJ37112.1 hypothetical protein [Baekduia sp.]
MYFRQLLNDTSACASYLPEESGVDFDHHPLADGEVVHLGNYLHAHGEHTIDAMARMLYRSLTERLLALPDHLLLYPGH